MIQARIVQERDEHEKAIQLYQEAGRLWPDNEYARYHAARSAEQIGDFEAAMEFYRHATRISVETTNAMSRTPYVGMTVSITASSWVARGPVFRGGPQFESGQ